MKARCLEVHSMVEDIGAPENNLKRVKTNSHMAFIDYNKLQRKRCFLCEVDLYTYTRKAVKNPDFRKVKS